MAQRFEIVEMVGEKDYKTGKWSKEWAICFGGVQWAPAGWPRDLDGSGGWTAPTYEEALKVAKGIA